MMVTDCGRGHFCVLKILTFNLEDSRHIFVYPPKITSHPFSVPHRLIFKKKKGCCDIVAIYHCDVGQLRFKFVDIGCYKNLSFTDIICISSTTRGVTVHRNLVL